MTTIKEMKKEVSMVSEMIERKRQRFNNYRDRVIKPIIAKGLKTGRLYSEDIQVLAEFYAESEKFTNEMAQSAKLATINYQVLATFMHEGEEEIKAKMA